MDVQVMSQLIGSLGFPIFITVYFITNLKKTLDGVVVSLNSNTQIISRLEQKIESNEKVKQS